MNSLPALVSLVSLIVLFGVSQCAYVPPRATVEPLYPKGLRISVPDEQGITLVAFHVKFNEDFESLEAGTIARDIIKVRKGRWTYEDRTTELKRDDIIYYWVHVVYEGLGYNLLNQEHRVTQFYNYDGTPVQTVPTGVDQTCTSPSLTWVIGRDGERISTCPGQLLFDENFDNLNASVWSAVEKFSDAPDYEFCAYRNSDENINVANGRLQIKPILMDEKFSPTLVLTGTLTLEGCTGAIGSTDCERRATGSYILPPVISGRLNTKNSFVFQYGRIEIRAKMPRGDWLYPLLSLESLNNSGANRPHCQMRIASTVGNVALRSRDGQDLSGRVLWAGALESRPPSMGESPYGNRSILPRRQSSTLWSNDYHTYELIWRSDRVIVKVDNVEYGEQEIGGPFHAPFFINLGLAVGGYAEFPDMCTSGDYEKPWRNVAAKALYNFYEARNNWYRTWTREDSAVVVDYVKVWAL